jgi:hypothetical protein
MKWSDQSYVDSDHAWEKFTRCSRTVFLICLNMAPSVWFSKQKPTMESSVFGAGVLQWGMASRLYVGSAASCEWCVCSWATPARYMGTTCMSSIIRSAQSPCWGRSQTSYVTMLLETQLLWVNVSWHMYALRTTLSIFALRLWIPALWPCWLMTMWLSSSLKRFMGPWGFPYCPLEGQLEI